MSMITVFCGASTGVRQEYRSAAREVGRHLAEAGHGLVYGGAATGLMGEVADGVLEHGGKAIGILPEDLLVHEVAHQALTELRVVRTMHERKELMASLGDAFVALPGGMGTAEEFFEVVTWAQLGLHGKPCALVNVLGYFDPLLDFLRHACREGFVHQRFLDNIIVTDEPAELLGLLSRHEAQPHLFTSRGDAAPGVRTPSRTEQPEVVVGRPTVQRGPVGVRHPVAG